MDFRVRGKGFYIFLWLALIAGLATIAPISLAQEKVTTEKGLSFQSQSVLYDATCSYSEYGPESTTYMELAYHSGGINVPGKPNPPSNDLMISIMIFYNDGSFIMFGGNTGDFIPVFDVKRLSQAHITTTMNVSGSMDNGESGYVPFEDTATVDILWEGIGQLTAVNKIQHEDNGDTQKVFRITSQDREATVSGSISLGQTPDVDYLSDPMTGHLSTWESHEIYLNK